MCLCLDVTVELESKFIKMPFICFSFKKPSGLKSCCKNT